MNDDIIVSHNKYGPVFIMHQHKDGLPHNGFSKGDRVRIKDTGDLDSVYDFAKNETGTVICTFPTLREGKVSVFVSLDRDKGKWSEADEGELFSENVVEKINE